MRIPKMVEQVLRLDEAKTTSSRLQRPVRQWMLKARGHPSQCAWIVKLGRQEEEKKKKSVQKYK